MHALLMGKIAGQETGEYGAEEALQIARPAFGGAFLLVAPLMIFGRRFTRLTLVAEFADAVDVTVFFILPATFRRHAIPAVVCSSAKDVTAPMAH